MLGNKLNLELISIFPVPSYLYSLLFCQLHIARWGDKTPGCKSTVNSVVAPTNYKTSIQYHSKIKVFSINHGPEGYKF